MVKNEMDAEDLLQNSFVDVFTKLDSFRFQSSIGAWIKRIVVNNCINFLKKKRLYFEEIDERSGNIEEIVYESTNDAGSTWDFEEKEVYQIDANSNRLVITYSYYDGSSWVLQDKTENSYDTNTPLSGIYQPFDELVYETDLGDFPYTNKVLDELNSYYNASSWEIQNRIYL